MARRKPAGWPKYMLDKRLRSGDAFYWNLPTWAKKAGCPMKSEALGSDYAKAKLRCDTILNPQFDSWRTRGEGTPQYRSTVGTFDWLLGIYRAHPKYTKRPPKVKKSYDAALRTMADFKLKTGRRIGDVMLESITPLVVDKIYEKIRVKADGTTRNRTALLVVSVCRVAWNCALRSKSKLVPTLNPFAKIEITYSPKQTRPATQEELTRFVTAADEAGEASIGTAAMIAYFWLQRQVDILGRLSWGHYRPVDAPQTAKIFHHKTGKLVPMPLYDMDGTRLWPEIMDRLDAAERTGSLIVMRDAPDRRRKVHLPWQVDTFRHRVAAIREAAGIDKDVKFMGLRHGGNVEGAEADLTDAQLRALSGHKTTAALLRYAPATTEQAQVAARKRLNQRTKKGSLSE